ncbi:MAG: multiheme c-type cytochrome [Proteobacteria bacterium]|nr:multiheme c-type cytochrome [Pseudomonadota bacterium]
MKLVICTIGTIGTILMAFAGACGDDTPTLSIEELQDPETCKTCHPTHYQEWAASMHAYASDDPIFVAMNNRGQADTNNALGPFCVSCHAPMAVALGTTNGLDFDPAALPKAQRGITCYFCHNVTGVGEPHNNSLTLAMDTTMRGGITNPVGNAAHKSAYLPSMDGNNVRNDSSMCGSCHDIVTPGGVHLERTFADWKTTIFAQPDPVRHLNCASACHMGGSDNVVADDPTANVPFRANGLHEHTFAAIDQAMTPWPDMALNAQRIQRDLDPAVTIVGIRSAGGAQHGGICVLPDGTITVRLDTIGTGHSFPSGASHDRRTWLEIVAYDASNAVVYSSGTVPDGVDPEVFDPNIVGFWDRTYQDAAKTQPAHFFWDVGAVDSILLKPPITTDPNDPAYDHSSTATLRPSAGVINQIDRIEARLRVRPFPFAMLDALIASGHLDAKFRAMVPTLDIAGTKRTWTRATQGALDHCNPF